MSLLETVLAGCADVTSLRDGGQRSAYRTRHPKHGDVVVKYTQCRSDTSLQRLSREAEFLKKLDSCCIPKLFEIILDLGSKECLTIEAYIPSRELDACRDLYTEETQIAALLQSLIRCLKPVWADRVVHRDLKPTNIVIAEEDSRPCVVDFGIARFLNESSLTRSAALMGPATPLYAAPEQLLNQKHLIDVRTDFFALGIIALELYLGVHPFAPELVGGGSIPENIVDGRYVSADSREGVSANFVSLTRRLLQRQPFLRFRTPEMVEDFLNSHWEEVV